jgi:hypothetical protein
MVREGLWLALALAGGWPRLFAKDLLRFVAPAPTVPWRALGGFQTRPSVFAGRLKAQKLREDAAALWRDRLRAQGARLLTATHMPATTIGDAASILTKVRRLSPKIRALAMGFGAIIVGLAVGRCITSVVERLSFRDPNSKSAMARPSGAPAGFVQQPKSETSPPVANFVPVYGFGKHVWIEQSSLVPRGAPHADWLAQAAGWVVADNYNPSDNFRVNPKALWKPFDTGLAGVNIECVYSERDCTIVTLFISGRTPGENYLNVNGFEHASITKWTAKEVVAVLDHDCNKEIWTLSASEKSIRYRWIPKGKDEHPTRQRAELCGYDSDFSYRAHLDEFEVAVKQWY